MDVNKLTGLHAHTVRAGQGQSAMSEVKPATSAYQLFQRQKHAEVKAALEVRGDYVSSRNASMLNFSLINFTVAALGVAV